MVPAAEQHKQVRHLLWGESCIDIDIAWESAEFGGNFLNRVAVTAGRRNNMTLQGAIQTSSQLWQTHINIQVRNFFWNWET